VSYLEIAGSTELVATKSPNLTPWLGQETLGESGGTTSIRSLYDLGVKSGRNARPATSRRTRQLTSAAQGVIMAQRGRHRKVKSRKLSLDKLPTGAIASTVALSGVLASSGTALSAQVGAPVGAVPSATPTADNLQVDSAAAKASAS
jgi:hypothetical protein